MIAQSFWLLSLLDGRLDVVRRDGVLGPVLVGRVAGRGSRSSSPISAPWPIRAIRTRSSLPAFAAASVIALTTFALVAGSACRFSSGVPSSSLTSAGAGPEIGLVGEQVVERLGVGLGVCDAA